MNTADFINYFEKSIKIFIGFNIESSDSTFNFLSYIQRAMGFFINYIFYSCFSEKYLK